MSTEPIIEAKGLTRHYGDRVAVDHIDFSITRGEVFGFLGPNGAGKSTTVRMLTGYIPPTSGTARVAGCDIVTEPVAARQHIAVVPEEASAYADLSVWQNIMLMGELYSISRGRRLERGRELTELFGLADRRGQKGRDLSKGLRQRLMLCMALVSDPVLSSLVRLPLIFISGVFVPHAEMPPWGQRPSPLSPLSYSADLIRVGFGGTPYFPVPLDIAALVGFAMLFLAAARYIHRLTRDKAR